MTMYWLNGHPLAGESLISRAQAYGDGLFETMLFIDGHCMLLEYHRERLMRGVDVLGLSFSSEMFASALAPVANLSGVVRVKLMVARKGAADGYAGTDACDVQVSAHQYEQPMFQRDMSLCTSSFRLSSQPYTFGLKTLNRLEQVVASRYKASDFDEMLCVDDDNNLVDGLYHNVFFIAGDKVITPRINTCGISGTMRAWVLEQVQLLGIGADIVDVPLKLLRDDTNELVGAFMTNALNGVRSVSRIDSIKLQKHEITNQLQQIERNARRVIS